MARWALTNKHYLNVPGTEWEHKELDMFTGKQARKVYPVPRFLNPEDPADWTHKEIGTIVVCHEGKGEPRDLPFIGPPTPDMSPLDDEARAISKIQQANYKHPIESLSGDYSDTILAALQRQLDAALPISAGQVSQSDFAKLQEQVAALMERNTELEARPRRV
jgi:hypothetical protein